MNPTNRGLLVAGTGAIALQLGLTNAMLHFLRPEMRPYLVASGAVLLILGLVVAVVAARSHVAGSIDEMSDSATRKESEAIAGGEPVLPISDYIGASRGTSNTSYLAAHDVRVIGFVTPADDSRDRRRFFVTRFTIGCCAADAIPLQLDVLTTPAMRVPNKDRWVEVTVRLVKPQPKQALITLVRATSLRGVGKPAKPYDRF